MRKVAVLGAGLMGHGIAQVAARAAKCEVSLRDVRQEFLDNGMGMIRSSLQKFLDKGTISREEMNEILGRIYPTVNLREAVVDADLIIEAVPESVDIKRTVLMEVDGVAKKDAVMTSNTSSISITLLASFTRRPEKFCGMHFFNPPQLMRLVEVVKGTKTSDDTVNVVVEAAKKMGKEPVVVKKDSPGFIVNRVLVSALNEALYLVWEGVADRDEIDKAIRLGLNWPMGPLTLLDHVGLDTTLAILEVFQRELGELKYQPCPLLTQMVKTGLLGRKTGKGFYDWEKK
ncbi:MAG: 3-hydroxyacyl-CoA dehydrogenase family protein [Candidatus Bathyarchaeota archaeon]|nr:MAG: 3-hydroxyacyl-CoA dehydrogenase family protein [Candidatus Bathyarchaeota archaeon]